jgi:hypothetical protein
MSSAEPVEVCLMGRCINFLAGGDLLGDVGSGAGHGPIDSTLCRLIARRYSGFEPGANR